jgi:hypothetical protein
MINHEQAAILRAVKLGAVVDCDGLTEDLYDFVSPSDDWGRDPGLSDSGENALAEYEAHYATIETAELERLRALERGLGTAKFNAREDALRLVARQIECALTGEAMHLISEANEWVQGPLDDIVALRLKLQTLEQKMKEWLIGKAPPCSNIAWECGYTQALADAREALGVEK